MTKNRYSREFENQALVKVRERADKSVGTIAQELGMSEGTLRKWVTNANRKERAATPEAALPIDVAASAWSAAQRLLALQAVVVKLFVAKIDQLKGVFWALVRAPVCLG